MRVAAALVGVAGVFFGILISGMSIAIAVGMMLSIGDFAILLVDLAMIGSEAVIILFCVVGLIGVGSLMARRGRKGIYLMLTAAIAIAVVRIVQPVLVSAAGSIGISERFAAEPSPIGSGLSIPVLLPSIALLLASALGAYTLRAKSVRT